MEVDVVGRQASMHDVFIMHFLYSLGQLQSQLQLLTLTADQISLLVERDGVIPLNEVYNLSFAEVSQPRDSL